MQQIDKIKNLLQADYKEKSFKDSNTQTNEINFKAEKQATAIINILEGYFGINSVKKAYPMDSSRVWIKKIGELRSYEIRNLTKNIESRSKEKNYCPNLSELLGLARTYIIPDNSLERFLKFPNSELSRAEHWAKIKVGYRCRRAHYEQAPQIWAESVAYYMELESRGECPDLPDGYLEKNNLDSNLKALPPKPKPKKEPVPQDRIENGKKQIQNIKKMLRG